MKHFFKITHSPLSYLKFLTLPPVWWRDSAKSFFTRKVYFREGTPSEKGGSELANLVTRAFPFFPFPNLKGKPWGRGWMLSSARMVWVESWLKSLSCVSWTGHENDIAPALNHCHAWHTELWASLDDIFHTVSIIFLVTFALIVYFFPLTYLKCWMKIYF